MAIFLWNFDGKCTPQRAQYLQNFFYIDIVTISFFLCNIIYYNAVLKRSGVAIFTTTTPVY